MLPLEIIELIISYAHEREYFRLRQVNDEIRSIIDSKKNPGIFQSWLNSYVVPITAPKNAYEWEYVYGNDVLSNVKFTNKGIFHNQNLVDAFIKKDTYQNDLDSLLIKIIMKDATLSLEEFKKWFEMKLHVDYGHKMNQKQVMSSIIPPLLLVSDKIKLSTLEYLFSLNNAGMLFPDINTIEQWNLYKQYFLKLGIINDFSENVAIYIYKNEPEHFENNDFKYSVINALPDDLFKEAVSDIVTLDGFIEHINENALWDTISLYRLDLINNARKFDFPLTGNTLLYALTHGFENIDNVTITNIEEIKLIMNTRPNDYKTIIENAYIITEYPKQMQDFCNEHNIKIVFSEDYAPDKFITEYIDDDYIMKNIRYVPWITFQHLPDSFFDTAPPSSLTKTGLVLFNLHKDTIQESKKNA